MKFVGEIIKNDRISKKISLDIVANELNISKDLLKKIDSDEVDKNISITLFIGHLRSYSNYLGLNSKEIIEQFKLQNTLEFKEQVNQIPKPLLVKKNFGIGKITTFSLIVIIFYSFYYLFVDIEKPKREYALIPDLPENLEPIVEKTEIDLYKNNKQKIIDINKKIESERLITSSSANASLNLSKSKENDQLITLKILNPTWVQIRDLNNAIILSQLMVKNEEYSYNLNLNYSITAGNAGNVLVLIDNKVKGKIGDTGQVVDSIVIESTFNN